MTFGFPAVLWLLHYLDQYYTLILSNQFCRILHAFKRIYMWQLYSAYIIYMMLLYWRYKIKLICATAIKKRLLSAASCLFLTCWQRWALLPCFYIYLSQNYIHTILTLISPPNCFSIRNCSELCPEILDSKESKSWVKTCSNCLNYL